MPVIMAMKCLGRICLSDPTARDAVWEEDVGDPSITDPEQVDGKLAWEVILQLFLSGSDYLEDYHTCVSNRECEEFDIPLRLEAAGALASIARHHKVGLAPGREKRCSVFSDLT